MISILIPIHNTETSFISECLDSIDSQTLTTYEIIIVNDGSNEEVTNFLKSLRRKKCRVYHREKLGISNALNYGIAKCKYEIIARMDADDIMLPHRLQIQYEYLNNNKNVDVLGAQMEIFGLKTGVTNHKSTVDKNIILSSHFFINHPTVMLKKKVINKIGGYDSNFDGLEDLELWCRVLYNGYKIENLEDILVMHRRHLRNVTSTNNKDVVLEKINFLRKYYSEKYENKQ